MIKLNRNGSYHNKRLRTDGEFEEIYCEWWGCPRCGVRDDYPYGTYIMINFKYCPYCGEEIKWFGKARTSEEYRKIFVNRLSGNE